MGEHKTHKKTVISRFKLSKTPMTKLEKNNMLWIYLFLFPSILVFVSFYLFPIITVVTTSFTTWDGINSPKWVGLSNYSWLFHNEAFIMSMKNLLFWSLLSAIPHVAFGVLIALILFKKPFGGNFVKSVFMIPNIISVAAWAIIYKFIFNNDFGILNRIIRIFNPGFKANWFFESPYAFWAVTLTWLFYGVIVTLIVLNDLNAIPREIGEAAKIDGASGWQVLRNIYLPLCRISIGTSIILAITSRVGMYEAIALTTRGGPGNDTMSLSLILVKLIMDMKYGSANVIGMVMLIIGIAILLLINKLFRMNESVY
ncbi:carbohydrate ABC transporter permease [Clostridium arbusti]|uniref:carbohydrate ABC transporter permease n=1 Tax=Clostridium arbusti TaxID=1137848 RepID=UPI000287A542|nr:sugar ABC transporter permease [Clostridium arbusti]